MKALQFNYENRNRRIAHSWPLKLERVIIIVFLAVFIMMLAVQGALTNPSLRSVLTVEDKIEGSPLGAVEYLYNAGSMELRLENAESNTDVKVLVNGEPLTVFNNKSIKIDIKEGDVVEIDASEAAGSIEVTIAALSENFDQEYLGSTYKIDGGVTRLLKVRMPQN